MRDRVRIHVDPRCPWCYQTARWMRLLEEAGETAVTWAVFSLAIVHEGEAARPDRAAAPALRALIAVRRAHGDDAAGRFYLAVADAVHLQRREVDDPDVLRDALRGAGVDESLLQTALADPETWTAVQDEHDEAVRVHGAFGVPTIVLQAEDGGAIFGPVLSEVPPLEEAVELWHHVRWLIRNPNFAELKRGRQRVQLRERKPPVRSHRAA